ncbi:MAG: T9SS type A sorting domain-containing protein, partial [Bacteroidota bacterium]
AILGETASALEIYPEARYLLQGDELLPIYRITTRSVGEVLSYEILIDARNGQELSREDHAAYFRPMTGGDTSAVGRVFFPDPCTVGEVAYGVSFTDNDDAHTPIFDSLMDTVTLKDLTYDNGIFRLEGPYVRVLDLASFSIPPATSTDGKFFFTRDEDGFEDVMVYFHIDSFHRYVESLGFTNLRHNGQAVRADAHGKGDSDQSAFIINNGNPYMVFGDGGVDDAEDADVIIHEFGHYLSFAASPFTLSGNERRGLDEGIADFFTATYSNMASSFDRDNIFNWDGHNEFWPGRVVNSNRLYPPTSSSIYILGEIWASALREMAQQIPDSIMMRLQLQEMYSNTINMSLPDAALLLIDADSMLYNGAHAGIISESFCDRGVLTGLQCSIFVNVEPEVLPTSWNVFPNPSQGTFQVEWQEQHPAQVRLFDLQGRELYQQNIQPGLNQISPNLSGGIYFVQIWQKEQFLDTRKLIIQRD